MKINNITMRPSFFLLAALSAPLHAAPESLPEGAEFGSVHQYLAPASDDLILSSELGALHLFSGDEESTRGALDGGVQIYGTPIRLLLGTYVSNDGRFEIIPADGMFSPALFAVDSSAETAEFNNVDVAITGGTLTVGGSPVATQSGLPLILEGLSGKVVIGNGTASGTSAVAIGLGSSTASGNKSVALGEGTRALTYAESALGIFNASASGDATQWIGTDTLLSLGNGTSSGSRSDALRVLKNGKLTVTNKTWNSGTPLADPNTGDSTDSGGDALDVKGHTTLEG